MFFYRFYRNFHRKPPFSPRQRGGRPAGGRAAQYEEDLEHTLSEVLVNDEGFLFEAGLGLTRLNLRLGLAANGWADPQLTDAANQALAAAESRKAVRLAANLEL